MKTYGNEDLVLGAALVFHPLAEAADGDTRRFPHAGLSILQTGLDERPHLVHEGSEVLATSLH